MASYGIEAKPHGADFNGSQTQMAGTFSRENIPHDKVIAPYTLTGTRRSACLVIYGLIVCSAFLGTLYSLYASPLFVLAMIPVSYVVNNVAFLTVHSKLHASFIELPEEAMGVICHNSFIHHYRNTKVYHEKWLETRLAYLMDPRIVFDGAFWGYFVLLPLISIALFLVDPILGIAFFSMQYLAELLQSTIHEWYHNPVRNRKSFYSLPVYWAFTLLERIGVASTKRHLGHHRHNLSNLEEVEVWLDLPMPLGEAITARFWKAALTKYVPGQSNMTRYVLWSGTAVQFLAFSVVNPLLFLAMFRLVA